MKIFYGKVSQLMAGARRVGVRETRMNKILITLKYLKKPPKTTVKYVTTKTVGKLLVLSDDNFHA